MCSQCIRHTYKLTAPRKEFFWPAFVTRILTPRSRKSSYGFLLGCRSPLDAGPFVKTFFWMRYMFEPAIKTARKSSPASVLVRHRNRSGVVKLVGMEPLMFARVENGVTKFSPKRQTPKFWISERAVFSANTVPLEFHRLRDSRLAIANNTLRVAKRRDQASSQAPEPPLLPDGKIDISNLPSWYDRRFLEHAHYIRHFSVT